MFCFQLQAFEESNDISGIKLGKVISRFVIECAQPSDEGAYTCMANAGIEEATTPPTTVIVEGMYLKKRIIYYHSVFRRKS
jgi:hypothetical protein